MIDVDGNFNYKNRLIMYNWQLQRIQKVFQQIQGLKQLIQDNGNGALSLLANRSGLSLPFLKNHLLEIKSI